MDALDHWFATAPAGARIEDGYGLAISNMHSSAWDIAKADAAIRQMPLDERLTYASLYATLGNWRVLLGEEKSNSEELGNLLVTADDPDSRRKVRLSLMQARNLLDQRIKNYAFLFAGFDKLEIRPDASGVPFKIDSSALCEPLRRSG